MTDAGLLLTLPAQSVAVRLVVAAILAVITARLLLRSGLRVPHVRVVTALLPALALVLVLALSAGNFRLPVLMLPSSGSGSVLLPMENTYATLAPMALPALIVAWVVMVAWRVTGRLRHQRMCARHADAAASAAAVPARVRETVADLAERLDLAAPRLAMVACPGGAAVVGLRRPILLLDPELVDALDDHELEGVVGHELSHIQRRDNLVALLLSLIRDVLFFVPGGRWALRHLLVERELAADDHTVHVTRRPGALAGGLLKVIDTAGPNSTCAALLPSDTLVQRVNLLLDQRPDPSRRRRVGEVIAVLTAIGTVLAGATMLPRALAGQDPDGGFGLLLAAPARVEPVATTPPQAPPARVFATYEHVGLQERALTGPAAVIDDDPALLSRTMMAKCQLQGRTCGVPTTSATLALLPTSEADTDPRWHAHPVVETGELFGLYRLTSLK